MARNYLVPPDTNEKEKAIGGVLTFGQAGWLAGGFIIGVLCGAGIYLLTQSNALTVIFAIPGILAGAIFCFAKKHDMSLFTYIIRKKKFEKKPKYLPNKKGV